MPEPDQPGRELGDMYVLTTGVDATNGSQRARVFRNQGYPHLQVPSSGVGPQAGTRLFSH